MGLVPTLAIVVRNPLRLPFFMPFRFVPSASMQRKEKIGIITHGSLNKGVEMKLDAEQSVEHIKAGKFVVIEGRHYDFFSMITDIAIEAANDNILLNPPSQDDTLLLDIMQGSSAYVTVSLKPMLMMQNQRHQELDEAGPRPVKTVPAHFSQVAEANEEDVSRIFGHEALEGGNRFFHIGNPLDMDTPVCIDLERFVERSNAVFGKTGTGKTFLTRLLLAGTIKTGRAVNVIFDMHSEYGWRATQEGEGAQFVQGLRNLFPNKVTIFTLDPASTRRRGASADHEVFLYADQIHAEDILPLRDTLSLNPTAAESTYALQSQFGKKWLIELLSASTERVKELAEICNAHENSLLALKRKLQRIERYGFFKTESVGGRQDVLDALIETLDRGKSVILEFGRYDDLPTYMLVANVITRRLRQVYEEKAATYARTQDTADRPHPLIITIEEAHKFLAPSIARETPFGKIAREMRKFFVSLLVVDQRPSAIDEEVLSQIGTKIVAQLNDEKDIGAALVGTSGASALRQVLASLDSKQQALILGHAVPMPIVVRTRSYDADFFKAMSDAEGIVTGSFEEANARSQNLFG